jgi:hypothetical protein
MDFLKEGKMPNRETPQKQNTSAPKADVPPKYTEDTHKKFQPGNQDEEYLADAAENEGEHEPQEMSGDDANWATEADESMRLSESSQAKSKDRWESEELNEETDFERTGRESLIDNKNSSQRGGKTSTH